MLKKWNQFAAIHLVPARRIFEKMVNHIWYNYPFGNCPKGSREDYLQLAAKTKHQTYPEVDTYEQAIGISIDREWLDNLALHTQIVIKDSPLCYAHGRILYSALASWLRRNPVQSPAERITIWETGTARGFSALCMAKALSDHNRAGAIITFDVLPHQTPMYWNCIDDTDGPQTRSDLLSSWNTLANNYLIFHQGDTRIEMPKLKTGRVHFAFLDGAHTYDDVMFEFQQIKNLQQSGDMIVYDDYTPNKFPGLVKAVDKICSSHGYHRTDVFAHNERGYVIAEKK